MADDVNKSGKSVNGSTPKSIKEIQAERERRLNDINQKRASAHSEISRNIEDFKDDYTYAAGAEERAEALEGIKNQAGQRGVVNARAAVDMAAQNKIIADRLSTYTKERNVNQRTTTQSNYTRYFQQARNSDMLSVPTEVLEQRIAAGTAEINSLGEGLSNAVRGSNRGLESEFNSYGGKIGEREDEIALLKRVKAQQARQGLSTEKIYNTFENTVNSGKAGLDILTNRGITNAAKEGKFGSLEEETDKLKSILSRLESTFTEYQEASERYTADQSEVNKKALDISLKKLENEEKAVENQKKIVRAVDTYGGGGGGGTGAAFAQYGAHMRSMIGSGMGIDIDDKIMEMRLKAETGSTAVDQFNRVNSGIGGDMRSLLRESTSQEFIKAFSDNMRSKATRQGVYNTIADGVSTVGTGIDVLSGDANPMAIGSAAMGTIRSGSQVFRGLPQTAKAMEAYRAGQDFAGVANEIPAQLLQAVYDQQMAAYSGTMGLGGAAQAAEATLMDKQSLGNFAKAGLTPAQAASLTSMSSGALGGAEAATSVARRAGEMSQTRLVSAEQYIGMAGQLAGAGGGSADLEEIMKNAVAAGMDNAKNIQQMVSATVGLSANMAKMGISGTNSSASVLSATMASIGGDKNIAALAAESMINKRAAMDASGDINLGNVIESRELRGLDSQMSPAQLMMMQKLTPQDYQAIVDGGRDAAAKFGLGSVFDRGGSDAFIKGSKISAKATGINLGLGTFGGNGKDFAAIDAADPSQLSEDAMALSALAGMRGEGLTIQAGRKVAKGELSRSNSMAQNFMQENAGRMAQTFGSAGNPDEVLKQILVTMQALAQTLSPEKAQGNVEKAMNDMKGVGPVVKAGEDFKSAAQVFTQGVDKFNKLLDKADLGEHKTSFNLQDNRGNNSTRRTG